MKPIQTWEVQTKCQVKSNRMYSSILRLSLRQYVEPQTDITFTFISVSFTFWNLCKSFNRPCRPVPCCLSLWLSLLSEPMHVCTLAHVWTLQHLAIWSTFWLSTTFLSFSEPMQVVIAPAVQFPMDLCSASAIQPISFLLVVSQNSPIQKLNCKSQIPDSLSLLFTLSNTQTHKLHYRSTSSLRILCKAPLL